MLVIVIVLLILCYVLVAYHGVEFVFNMQGTKYEMGLFYLLFGKLRFIEIKHIKVKKKKKRKKKKKIDLVFLVYLKASIDIRYTIATQELTPSIAILSSMVCSNIEWVDRATNLKITQYINYAHTGVAINIRVSLSLLNIALSYIKYKTQKRKQA